jgi:hypothetical protein
MGRGSNIACQTCRVYADLGYGSYATWLDGYTTVAAFDAAPEEHRGLEKNQNFRAFLAQHEGHLIVQWNEDWASREGDLIVGWDAKLIANLRDYRNVTPTTGDE